MLEVLVQERVGVLPFSLSVSDGVGWGRCVTSTGTKGQKVKDRVIQDSTETERPRTYAATATADLLSIEEVRAACF